MKFSIAAGPFIRILEILIEKRPKRGEPVGRVVACRGRVSVQWKDTVAGAEAVVWAEGQASLSLARLLKLARRHAFERNLNIHAGPEGLCLGEGFVPVLSYSPHADDPGACQIFFTSDWGVISSEPLPYLELAPAF